MHRTHNEILKNNPTFLTEEEKVISDKFDEIIKEFLKQADHLPSRLERFVNQKRFSKFNCLFENEITYVVNKNKKDASRSSYITNIQLVDRDEKVIFEYIPETTSNIRKTNTIRHRDKKKNTNNSTNKKKSEKNRDESKNYRTDIEISNIGDSNRPTAAPQTLNFNYHLHKILPVLDPENRTTIAPLTTSIPMQSLNLDILGSYTENDSLVFMDENANENITLSNEVRKIPSQFNMTADEEQLAKQADSIVKDYIQTKTKHHVDITDFINWKYPLFIDSMKDAGIKYEEIRYKQEITSLKLINKNNDIIRQYNTNEKQFRNKRSNVDVNATHQSKKPFITGPVNCETMQTLQQTHHQMACPSNNSLTSAFLLFSPSNPYTTSALDDSFPLQPSVQGNVNSWQNSYGSMNGPYLQNNFYTAENIYSNAYQLPPADFTAQEYPMCYADNCIEKLPTTECLNDQFDDDQYPDSDYYPFSNFQNTNDHDINLDNYAMRLPSQTFLPPLAPSSRHTTGAYSGKAPSRELSPYQRNSIFYNPQDDVLFSEDPSIYPVTRSPNNNN